MSLAYGALIVMAKAPVPGEVKTRLIPALGAEGAAALAERMLRRTLAAASGVGFDSVELCVSPGIWHPAVQKLAGEIDISLFSQGNGDLGQRMHRALARALSSHAQALLVGTDAPALDAALLRRAATALRSADAVFVPTFDGGYALVGLRRPAATLFANVAWSTPQVMATTRRRAEAAGLRWVELDAVADIDEPADLVHLPADLAATARWPRPAA